MTNQFIAIVNNIKTANTRYGKRVVVECTGNLKDFSIWRNGDDDQALALHRGDRITCFVNEKGKEAWMDIVPPYKPGDNIDYLKAYGMEDSATATTVKPVEVKVEPEVKIPDTTGGAYDRHIESLACKIADCYKSVQLQLPDLTEETTQKLATSVFIQFCKDTY